ncbi:hypothetical protein [Leeuwenhoekiella nanhaiensis]|uniref:Uncharacterized protein n=1 Tax=Leeuwenhoekiella nanhaiensis TaxID=1655491 RepID=A0A2G1VWI1_9FLAO|nr:hypothetical protein [Leeuwenhoekiella nanhaiensis]PHQ30970.1 hypothetical protein CJ305_01715 [Leeuwenhoekiella nanhaiensis]
MKISILLFTILSCFDLNAQYSGYYTINANINKNINVNGSVSEYKTIKTIDYGALEIANAQNELNRLENLKYRDLRLKEIAIEISNNPLKAYEYGTLQSISSNTWDRNLLKDVRKKYGIKEFRIDYVVPNPQIFNVVSIHRLQSVSIEGINTDIIFYLPNYNSDNKEINSAQKEYEEVIVGKETEAIDDQNNSIKIFIHMKDLNRSTIYGFKGYKMTIAWEDAFEKGITDNYTFIDNNSGNGLSYFIKVRHYGDKDTIDFEKIEGRRYYLQPLIDKIISTAKAYVKY